MAMIDAGPADADEAALLQTLERLRLPVLAGRRVLEVGSGDGRHCGFALFQGAADVVGFESDEQLRAAAAARFPSATFVGGSWDDLPPGPFDVVLAVDCLQHAPDPEAGVQSMLSRLAPEGVLVADIGVAAASGSTWVPVATAGGPLPHPSMAKVREIFSNHAWKWLGPGGGGERGRVERQVFHVRRRRPVAYLLMQPPAFGKTSLAQALFPAAGVPIIAGDDVVLRIVDGRLSAPPGLRSALEPGFSPFRIDESIRRAFDQGLGDVLLGACIGDARGTSLALDMYVPAGRQAEVEHWFTRAGYLAVTLRWDRAGQQLPGEADARASAADYVRFLSDPAGHAPAAASVRKGIRAGFLDEARLKDGRLMLRGWAFDADGDMPAEIIVELAGEIRAVAHYERQVRQDVQRHFGLPHSLLGFSLVCELGGMDVATASRKFQMRLPDGTPFGQAAPLKALLAAAT
jgi:SAM-dependent methyltransferase